MHDLRLYDRVLRMGSLGLGEAYMDGWWDALELDEFFNKLLRADVEKRVRADWRTLAHVALQRVVNPQRSSRAFNIGMRHYDLGNELYQAMLDARMVYTCGYWKEARTLDEAQEVKLDLVCKKLQIARGMRILDIGCGWGSFAKFAAEKYGAEVTGITVSQQQVALGRELCKGLPVQILFKDYRDIEGVFDRVVSLGMFEHVGYKNYRTYMKAVHARVKDGGIFLLHTIGGNISATSTDPWIERYIFPDSMLPSIAQIARSVEGLFVMEDWHNFGADYDTTLCAWFANFNARWEILRGRYGERFYRMWKYYLLACAGSFRARKNQLWQIALSKGGIAGGYQSIR